jgi:protein ImuA
MPEPLLKDINPLLPVFAGNDEVIRHREKSFVISELQKDILRLQGFNEINSASVDVGLGPIKYAFPNASFPLGAVHEFVSTGAEAAAATDGFLMGLLSTLMGIGGTSLWISSSRMLFPPALKNFGIQPDRFIFIDLQKEKDVLWAVDEALKCGALTAVVGELQEISFTASRRLQLAVEQSQVTGFILRRNPRQLNTTACVSRWKITSIPSESLDGLPGIGFPQWKAELLRIRNGKPGSWEIRWADGRFQPVYKDPALQEQHMKAG